MKSFTAYSALLFVATVASSKGVVADSALPDIRRLQEVQCNDCPVCPGEETAPPIDEPVRGIGIISGPEPVDSSRGGIVTRGAAIGGLGFRRLQESCFCPVCPGEAPPAPDQPSPDSNAPVGAKGDPHFKTFGGEMYDFHGECDLVLLHNPEFQDNLGMDIHIRTKIQDFWSSIESAVIKIGDETLEVRANRKSKDWLWINGQLIDNIENGKWYDGKLSGFLVRYKETSSRAGLIREAKIYDGGFKEVLMLKAFKSFVKVDISDASSANHHYLNAVGMLGSQAHDGARLGRDGFSLIKDVNAFGQEWQVRPEVDGKLFHSYEGAVTEGKCIMPPAYTGEMPLPARKRRLGEATLDTGTAEKVCSHLVDPEDRKACVFDVLATQDLTIAAVW